MKKYPIFLEYFLEDILLGNPKYSVKKMFSGYGIFFNDKIFALFIDGEFFFRENIFNHDKRADQFFYFRKNKKIFLPYFRIDEVIFDDKENVEIFIQASLDY